MGGYMDRDRNLSAEQIKELENIIGGSDRLEQRAQEVKASWTTPAAYAYTKDQIKGRLDQADVDRIQEILGKETPFSWIKGVLQEKKALEAELARQYGRAYTQGARLDVNERTWQAELPRYTTSKSFGWDKVHVGNNDQLNSLDDEFARHILWKCEPDTNPTDRTQGLDYFTHLRDPNAKIGLSNEQLKALRKDEHDFINERLPQLDQVLSTPEGRNILEQRSPAIFHSHPVQDRILAIDGSRERFNETVFETLKDERDRGEWQRFRQDEENYWKGAQPPTSPTQERWKDLVQIAKENAEDKIAHNLTDPQKQKRFGEYRENKANDVTPKEMAEILSEAAENEDLKPPKN
jgi:hypothetical protein